MSGTQRSFAITGLHCRRVLRLLHTAQWQLHLLREWLQAADAATPVVLRRRLSKLPRGAGGPQTEPTEVPASSGVGFTVASRLLLIVSDRLTLDLAGNSPTQNARLQPTSLFTQSCAFSGRDCATKAQSAASHG